MERICDISAGGLSELLDRASKAGTEGICPVMCTYEIAKKAMEITCGRGVMCRDGLKQVYLAAEDIINGKGREDDLEVLETLLGVIIECADCELSYLVATTVDKLIKNFEDDFNAHIKRKNCSYLVCPGCHTVHISPEKCNGSGECIKICPSSAILGGEGMYSVIDRDKCTACNKCISVCPNGAIAGAGIVKPQSPTTPGSLGSAAAEAPTGRRRRRG